MSDGNTPLRHRVPEQPTGRPVANESLSEVQAARMKMRRGEWTQPTTYQLPGYVQCGMVAIPSSFAYDFLVYCQRNSRACPIIDITDPGDPEPKFAAPGADLRTDLPKYRVYRYGDLVEERTDVVDIWPDDCVAVLLGSSLTFDEPLRQAGVKPSPEVWVVRTNIPTRPAGIFHGRLIVTMRILRPKDVVVATQLTARFPLNHGAPIHIGNPADIGADLNDPIVGPPLKRIPSGMIPVFWACGVTPQQAALEARIPLMITHAPGHAFVTDLLTSQVALP